MINKLIKIPTGYLFTSVGSKGELETLSIGDYGKKYNVKADFLGFREEINGVPDTYCMPLSEKWVITVSTQYGCHMKCTFCLDGYTKIQTPNGPVNINELKVGDLVIGKNESGQIKINTITKVFKNNYIGKMIKIRLQNGSLLMITPNHEVKTKSGWKTAGELTENDDLIDF